MGIELFLANVADMRARLEGSNGFMARRIVIAPSRVLIRPFLYVTLPCHCSSLDGPATINDKGLSRALQLSTGA